jgi:hypothetical protein
VEQTRIHQDAEDGQDEGLFSAILTSEIDDSRFEVLPLEPSSNEHPPNAETGREEQRMKDEGSLLSRTETQCVGLTDSNQTAE